MTGNYLDITKSVMISSPAGSGKTEKLARRYIALLRNGSDVERILAITFTEKAAAEMKERILKILKAEDAPMFEKIREKMPRMRISTIHSFCLKLLKRFCFDLGIDPSLEVTDNFNSEVLWSEAVYESLLEDGSSGENLFYCIIRDKGIRGWNKLWDILRELHSKRPHIEMGIRGIMETADETPVADAGAHFKKILKIYSKCLQRYKKKKREKHLIDYDDLELMAYEALASNPEWQNILYSFDEHTDYILVDEFQDTSSLQWKIIDKLTEEWRSGLGLKRDAGITPTIFLVGDDKQSIYSFRGANVNIFRNAREKLSEWLGADYNFIEIKENYRSLPAIVNFVNILFEKLMPRTLYDKWKIEYTPFEPIRQGIGNVDLLLLESSRTIRENRKAEASAVAGKINELCLNYEIYDGETRRRCGYGDMAILLRSRTHLSVFEDALRNKHIPFVIVKGIGFYDAPEVAILRDLLFFLIDPMDNYCLFNILRSPLFSLDYTTLLKLVRTAVLENSFNKKEPHLTIRKSEAGALHRMLNILCRQEAVSIAGQQTLREQKPDGHGKNSLQDIVTSIDIWLAKAKNTRYAVMLEEILNETGAWQYFNEKQRLVNAKKFIKLIEEFETKGLTALEIRENLIKASAKPDEPKANVNTEGMNAVRILTIHAAKGLQFPMVFLPCLDEESKSVLRGNIVMHEDEDRIILAYEEDSDTRKTIPVFQRNTEKIQDEEKRLFYVAATRAMDYLCMSGLWKNNPAGKIKYISDIFDLNTASELPFTVHWLSPETPDAIESGVKTYPEAPEITRLNTEPAFLAPLDYKPSQIWLDVTEEIEEVRRKHGENWIVLGRAFHTLFEGISRGTVTMGNMENKIRDILKNQTLDDKIASAMKATMKSVIQRLDETGLLAGVIMPGKPSYAELPFMLHKDSRIYRGRIDRIIISGKTAHIYDYKTYPVSENEIALLRERYAFQMGLYKEAVEDIFSIKAQSYLFFTHKALLVKV